MLRQQTVSIFTKLEVFGCYLQNNYFLKLDKYKFKYIDGWLKINSNLNDPIEMFMLSLLKSLMTSADDFELIYANALLPHLKNPAILSSVPLPIIVNFVSRALKTKLAQKADFKKDLQAIISSVIDFPFNAAHLSSHLQLLTLSISLRLSTQGFEVLLKNVQNYLDNEPSVSLLVLVDCMRLYHMFVSEFLPNIGEFSQPEIIYEVGNWASSFSISVIKQFADRDFLSSRYHELCPELIRSLCEYGWFAKSELLPVYNLLEEMMDFPLLKRMTSDLVFDNQGSSYLDSNDFLKKLTRTFEEKRNQQSLVIKLSNLV